jgi:hypothetical protein
MTRCMLAAAAALTLALVALSSARAAPATIDDFFAAAALQPSDFPAGMTPVANGPISLDRLAAESGAGAADELSGLGFLGAYAQAERTTSPVALLSGAPAGIGDVITVFSSSDDAATWFGDQTQVVDGVGAQIASQQGAAFTVTGIAPLALALPGDQSAAYDLQGTASVAGIAVAVHVDIALLQVGPTVETVVVAATQDQSGVLQSVAQTLAANVQAALPLLGS